jgi:hypothetical protein
MLFTDDRRIKTDLKLLRQAMDNGWEVPPKLKKLAIAKVGLILSKSEDPRDITAAVRCLISADALNAKREETEQKNRHHQEEMDEQRRARIIAVAARLGLAHVVEGTVRGGPGGSGLDAGREFISGGQEEPIGLDDGAGAGFAEEAGDPEQGERTDHP